MSLTGNQSGTCLKVHAVCHGYGEFCITSLPSVQPCQKIKLDIIMGWGQKNDQNVPFNVIITIILRVGSQLIVYCYIGKLKYVSISIVVY